MDADKASAETVTRAEDLRLRYCTEGLGRYRLGSANSLQKEQLSKAFAHMLDYESGKSGIKNPLSVLFDSEVENQ